MKPRIAVMLAVLFGAAEIAEAARCYTFWTFRNVSREVAGPVNTECGTGREWMHSAPFGNWGVESRHSGTWDGFQFAGWEAEEDPPWFQWNSCTSRYRGPRYLPDNPQISRPNQENVYAVRTLRGRPGRTCASIHSGRTHTFRNEYLKLYELDLWDWWLGGNGSDYVTTIWFLRHNFTVSMRCMNQSDCTGSSTWHRSPSGRHSRTSVQVSIHSYYR